MVDDISCHSKVVKSIAIAARYSVRRLDFKKP